jgi:hypothetical protein
MISAHMQHGTMVECSQDLSGAVFDGLKPQKGLRYRTDGYQDANYIYILEEQRFHVSGYRFAYHIRLFITCAPRSWELI